MLMVPTEKPTQFDAHVKSCDCPDAARRTLTSGAGHCHAPRQMLDTTDTERERNSMRAYSRRGIVGLAAAASALPFALSVSRHAVAQQALAQPSPTQWPAPRVRVL